MNEQSQQTNRSAEPAETAEAANTQQLGPEDRILRLPEVEAVVGLRRSWLYEAIKVGDFPAPVRLTRRAVGWRSRDIKAWLDQREPAPTAGTR
jgi:prophage regulatory protein